LKLKLDPEHLKIALSTIKVRFNLIHYYCCWLFKLFLIHPLVCSNVIVPPFSSTRQHNICHGCALPTYDHSSCNRGVRPLVWQKISGKS
jgi:hypothetical protein